MALDVPGTGAVARALQQAWWTRQPGLLSISLRPLARLYALLALLHRALARPQAVGVPVLVVGNIIVGGAGKTPTVIAVLRLLAAYGWTPGVVSRGYGRRVGTLAEVHTDSNAASVGDEPLLIRRRAKVPVMVGRDRVAAARALLAAHPAIDVIVADDGLQHHRLARALEVLVFDERGVGNGELLPAGPLREPLPMVLTDARLALYNAAEPSTPLPGWLAQRRLAGVLPLDEWAAGASPTPGSWSALQGRALLAAAGIAAPERFFAALRAQGLSVEPLALPDHAGYDPLPWPASTVDVVVTEKDAVKLLGVGTGTTRVWVAPLDLEPDLGFAAAIKRHFPHPPSR